MGTEGSSLCSIVLFGFLGNSFGGAFTYLAVLEALPIPCTGMAPDCLAVSPIYKPPRNLVPNGTSAWDSYRLGSGSDLRLGAVLGAIQEDLQAPARPKHLSNHHRTASQALLSNFD